jgi:hypothetical protein
VEKLGQLPVLRQAHRLLGAALGVRNGALRVSVLALLLRAARKTISPHSESKTKSRASDKRRTPFPRICLNSITHSKAGRNG